MSVIRIHSSPVRPGRAREVRQPGAAADLICELPSDPLSRMEVGRLELVIAGLLNPQNRRGLPIVARSEAQAFATNAFAKLRPSPWAAYGVTDHEMYERALWSQRIANDSRGVMCDPWGGSAA